MEVVLHLTVHLPQADGTLVQSLLRHLLPVELEQLQQGRVVPQAPHRLQLGEGVYGAGDDLHQRQVDLLAAPALGIQELPDLQHLDSGAADGLRADGAGLLLDHALDADGHQVAPALGLLTLSLGTKDGVVVLGGVGLTVLHVELHGHLIKHGVEAHRTLTLLYHHRKHVGQLVAVAPGQPLQLTKAEVIHLLLPILVITLAGQPEVVVGDKLAVGVLVIFSGLGDKHGGKGTTFI